MWVLFYNKSGNRIAGLIFFLKGTEKTTLWTSGLVWEPYFFNSFPKMNYPSENGVLKLILHVMDINI